MQREREVKDRESCPLLSIPLKCLFVLSIPFCPFLLLILSIFGLYVNLKFYSFTVRKINEFIANILILYMYATMHICKLYYNQTFNNGQQALLRVHFLTVWNFECFASVTGEAGHGGSSDEKICSWGEQYCDISLWSVSTYLLL